MGHKTSINGSEDYWSFGASYSAWEIESRKYKAFDDIKNLINLPSNSNLKDRFGDQTIWEHLENKEIILKAVSFQGRILEFASFKLQNDKEVVIQAVTNHGSALKFASESLQQDADVLSRTEYFYKHHAFENAVTEYDYELILKHIPECYPYDKYRKIASMVVEKHNGRLLRYLQPKCHADKELIKIALTAGGHDNAMYILEFSALNDFEQWILWNDKDLALFALRINGMVLNYISDELKQDNDILRLAHSYFIERIFFTRVLVHDDIKSLLYDFYYTYGFPDEMYKDIALRMTQKFGCAAYGHLKEWLQKDRYIAMVTLRTDGTMTIPDSLKNDAEVQKAALDGIWNNHDYLWFDKTEYQVKWVRKIVLGRASIEKNIIHEAADHGLRWDQGMEELVRSNPALLQFRNNMTGLLPFMTFAADYQKAIRLWYQPPSEYKSISKPLETLYEMIRMNPNVVKLYNCNEP